MRAEANQVELSDGTIVKFEAPGVGYEMEAYGAIPSLGLLATKQIKADEVNLTSVEILKAQCFMVIHGAVEPRFSMEGGAGTRPALRLLPPDLAKLAAAIADLRQRSIEAAEAEARPTVADATLSEASASARK